MDDVLDFALVVVMLLFSIGLAYDSNERYQELISSKESQCNLIASHGTKFSGLCEYSLGACSCQTNGTDEFGFPKYAEFKLPKN